MQVFTVTEESFQMLLIFENHASFAQVNTMHIHSITGGLKGYLHNCTHHYSKAQRLLCKVHVMSDHTYICFFNKTA